MMILSHSLSHRHTLLVFHRIEVQLSPIGEEEEKRRRETGTRETKIYCSPSIVVVIFKYITGIPPRVAAYSSSELRL